ncbi:MAG: GTP-binding protein [Clostridia bacterium]|nr:GTP-binding protein [Clostridia bacterium]
MKDYLANEIRNIAIIGHSGEGKTSLTEALLYNAKAIDRIGKTADGNTVSDYDREEIQRKISVALSVCHLESEGVKINLIDVPGFPDFGGEQTAALAVCGSVLIVADANGSLSVGTERALYYVREHKIPAIVFLNGVDKENSNYMATVDALRTILPSAIAPIQIPITENGKMQGYISLMSGNSYEFVEGGRKKIDMPAGMQDSYEQLLRRIHRRP